MHVHRDTPDPECDGLAHRRRPSLKRISAFSLVLASGMPAASCTSDTAPNVGGAGTSQVSGQPSSMGEAEPAAGSGGNEAPSPTGEEMASPEGNGNGGAEGEGTVDGLPLASSSAGQTSGGDPDASSPEGGNEEVDSGGTQPPEPNPTGLSPNCESAEGEVPELRLALVTDEVNTPLLLTTPPDDDTRLFVVEKAGRVRVIESGEMQQAPFLDIADQIEDGGERGLLGMAFHPNYAQNGLLYVHYSEADDSDGVVSEFSVRSDDPNQADDGSERELLTVEQPFNNHNGGMIAFGPDDMLYLGFGDGGSRDDPNGAGQDLGTLLGKILRIDVNGRDVRGAYSIPEGNMGGEAAPEIWAYGLRNPWRFSFDACGGDLYIGDVGQNALEEVDFLPSGTAAGTNFGWRIMEGNICRPGGDEDCDQTGLTLPVATYARNVGVSITGGYVYRGSRVPGLRGYYLYADYASATFFRFRMQDGEAVDLRGVNFAGERVEGITSFGQDNAGEVYVTSASPDAVWRIEAN